MDEIPRAASIRKPELEPPGTPPHVAVACRLRDQQPVVIRAENDTNEDYEARSRLLAAALAFPANT